MRTGSVVRWILVATILVLWGGQILGVAIFAVPERFDGFESAFLSVLTLVIGIVPVAIVVWLYRHQPERQSPPPLGGGTSSGARTAGDLVEPISDRELEVLALVARGQTNKEIAATLSITVGTVKTHLNNINRKLDASSRTQAIARARDLGIL